MILGVKANNFRVIKHAGLKIPEFSVIIGKNGSGKTTLISVFDLTQRLISGDNLREASENIAPFLSEIFNINSEEKKIEIEIILQNKMSKIYRYCYSIVLNEFEKKNELIIDKESLSLIDETNKVLELIFKRNRSKLVKYNGHTEQEIPFKIVKDTLALATYTDDAAIEVAKELKSCKIIGHNTIIQDKPLSVISGEQPDTNTLNGLAVALYQKDRSAFDSAVKATKQIIPAFLAPHILLIGKHIPEDGLDKSENNIKRYFVWWNDEIQQENTLSAISLSGGNAKVIYLIFSLFYAEQDSFIAIEEIENGMHIGRVSRLLDQLRTQATNRDLQVMLTTHSGEVLNYVTPQEVIYCSNDSKNGATYAISSDTDMYKAIKVDLKTRDITTRDLIESGMFE